MARALQLRQPSDEALQMRIGEPRRVPRQSTSVFETSNFSSLRSYKQPPAGRQYYGKNIRAIVTERNLIIRILLLPSGSGLSIFLNFP